jgi:hypothetical protein
MCSSYYDNPACLARRSACQGKLIKCVAGVIGTAAYAAPCAACVYGAAATGGAALAACALPCGTTAAALQLAVQNCS